MPRHRRSETLRQKTLSRALRRREGNHFRLRLARGLRELEEAAARPFGHAVIGAHEVHRFLLLQGVAVDVVSRCAIGLGKSRVEKRDRHIERAREIPQPRGRDAICTAFVLLNLLKTYTNALRELLLRHPQEPAAMTKALPNVQIDRTLHKTRPRTEKLPTYMAHVLEGKVKRYGCIRVRMCTDL